MRHGVDTPEMDLLLACARSRWDASEAARVRALVSGSLDHYEVLRLCLRHRMLPLVYWQLKERVRAEPGAADLLARLRAPFVDNAVRALQLAGELVEILRLLEAAGVPAVPYKGPALAAQLYDNVALRPAGDLDIVVRRQDVLAARALLLRRGYRPRRKLTRSGQAFMLRSRYSEELQSTSFQVEVHWAFTNGDIGLPLELEHLLPGVRTVSLCGTDVSAFSDSDLILILAVHGAKHRWDRLEWICGLAATIHRASDLQWDGLLRRAAELGARRMLLLALRLSHGFFQAPVPPGILERAAADRAVLRLAAQVPGGWEEVARDPDAGSLATDLFRFGLRERQRDRLRFLLYRAVTPSRPELWDVFSLGRLRVPLHAFRRPFRLLRAVVPALRAYRWSNRA